MKIFNKFGGKKKKKNKSVTTPCVDDTIVSPAWHSKVEDVEYWETVAYGWICDAEGIVARDIAWARFVEAYPEHAEEICEDFWQRICHTKWHKHHHHHHHHHPYF